MIAQARIDFAAATATSQEDLERKLAAVLGDGRRIPPTVTIDLGPEAEAVMAAIERRLGLSVAALLRGDYDVSYVSVAGLACHLEASRDLPDGSERAAHRMADLSSMGRLRRLGLGEVAADAWLTLGRAAKLAVAGDEFALAELAEEAGIAVSEIAPTLHRRREERRAAVILGLGLGLASLGDAARRRASREAAATARRHEDATRRDVFLRMEASERLLSPLQFEGASATPAERAYAVAFRAAAESWVRGGPLTAQIRAWIGG